MDSFYIDTCLGDENNSMQTLNKTFRSTCVKVLALVTSFSTPSLASAEPFNGPYFGGQAGWGEREGRSAIVPTGTGVEDKRSGVDYSGFAGFDYAIGDNVVVGLEGEIGGGGKTLSNLEGPNVVGVIDPDWNYAISARLGVRAADRLLVYGRGGYASERITETFEGSYVVPGPPTQQTRWSDGYLVGAGVDYALLDEVSLRIEYRYRHMQEDYNAQGVLAGLVLHF